MYRSTWWSIKLPKNWAARQEEDCVSFCAQPPVGALQVSAARNSRGPVTTQDLYEFAADDQKPNRAFQQINADRYSGLATTYVQKDRHWREWWLKKGNTLVYLTYNVNAQFQNAEQAEIEGIVASLLITD